jgi:hypothetical protein
MEQAMANLTPGQIFLVCIGVLLAIFGFINTAGNAVEKVVKVWRAAKAPNDRQDERLQEFEAWREEMEAWRKEVVQALARDLKRFDNLDEGERITQRALLALLGHGIDGNNIEQMQKAQEALQEHLINR